MGKAEDIRLRLEDLMKEYLDCAACPPDRNCCDFVKGYNTRFYEDTALGLFGKDNMERLEREGKMVHLPDRRQYILQDTPCPALDTSRRCTAHSQLEGLGAISCLEFPLFYYERFMPQGVNEVIECLMADYRCHSVEAGWDRLEPEMRELAYQNHIPLYVAFYNIEPVFLRVPLSTFHRIRSKNLIPPQRPYLEPPNYKD
jgi:hypothetical protein